MADSHPKKWRLSADTAGWHVHEGTWAPAPGSYSWRVESEHPRLLEALRWLCERLLREGYEAKGTEALVRRIEKTEEMLALLAADIEAELEAPG